MGRRPSRRQRVATRARQPPPAPPRAFRRMGAEVGTGGVTPPLVACDVPESVPRTEPGRMIRHRPPGRGHPYEPDDEQRVPLLPLLGQPVEIRATSHGTLTAAVA